MANVFNVNDDFIVDDSGNVSVTGTVDGRDLATDGSKLDGVESGADVTDAANVEAAIEAISLSSVSGATGDEVLIVDASDGGLKAVLWENLPSGSGGGISNVVEDTSPQLGGDLDANGNAIIAATSGGVTAPDYTFDGDLDTGMFRVGMNQIGLATSGTRRVWIGDSGVYFGPSSLGTGRAMTKADAIGNAAAPAFAFSNDEDTGLFRQGTNSMGISAGGTERVRVDTSGLDVVSGTLSQGGSAVLVGTITASPTRIFEATTTTDIHGAAGAATDLAWTATTNNSTYVDTFTNGDVAVTANGAQEWKVHAHYGTINSTVNNRVIYRMRILRYNSSAVLQETIESPTLYIRDDAASYDEGIMAVSDRIFMNDGDYIEIECRVMDSTTASGTFNPSITALNIDKIDYAAA